MDRPAAGGFLGLTGPSAPRVVVAADAADYKKGCGWRRGLCKRVVFASAQGATAASPLRVADCPSGNAYKGSVTGFTFLYHTL